MLTDKERRTFSIITSQPNVVLQRGFYKGEEAAFISAVISPPGETEIRLYPLAMLLRDQDFPLVADSCEPVAAMKANQDHLDEALGDKIREVHHGLAGVGPLAGNIDEKEVN